MKKQERIEKAKAELIKCLDQFSTKEENIPETLFNVYRAEMNAIVWLLESKELDKNISAGDEEALDYMNVSFNLSEMSSVNYANKIHKEDGDWISVKDDLPNKGERVVVWVKYPDDVEFSWKESELANPDPSDHFYTEPNSGRQWMLGSSIDYVITHFKRIKPPQNTAQAE